MVSRMEYGTMKGIGKVLLPGINTRMKPGIESEMSGGIIWIKLGLEVGWNVLESQVLVVKYYLG